LTAVEPEATIGARMNLHRTLARSALCVSITLPAIAMAQSVSKPQPAKGVILEFIDFADRYGSRLMAAFDSIPASRYDYRPTPVQQSIGYIAQHLEAANYGLCEQLGGPKPVRTAKDALADTIKARWPKDTLLARLDASFRYCDAAIGRLPALDSPPLAATLIGFETDLAEHYSQLSAYMRLIGMVPPSALPVRARTAIELAPAALSPFAGTYEIAPGIELEVSLRDGALFVRSNVGGGAPIRLWPQSATEFFVKNVDAQITFVRDPSGAVSGLVLHQYNRERTARKVS
jgi:uncharacterized protein DUF3471/DinB family protein